MNRGEDSGVARRDAALCEVRAQVAQGARMAVAAQLTAAIAHDLNQPLMSISSNAGAALRRLRRDPPQLEELAALLREIVDQSQRAGRIVGSWQSVGQRSPVFRPLDLHVLVHEALALAGEELACHGIEVQLALGAQPGPLEGDVAGLRQVLANLIGNAIESMAASSGTPRVLRLASTGSLDEVELRVSDTGAGFAGPDPAFEPFAGKPGRLGMGLAICRSVVEAHGGRIGARACLPQGAEFSFTLPRRHPCAGAPA